MGERVHGHWCPQHLFVEGADGTGGAGGGMLIPDDRVLRFERLEEAFEHLVGPYRPAYTHLGLSLSLSTAEKVNECRMEKRFSAADLSKRNKRLIEKVPLNPAATTDHCTTSLSIVTNTKHA
jgi:hypothetical protein